MSIYRAIHCRNCPQIMTESFLWAGGQTQSLDSASSFFRQIYIRLLFPTTTCLSSENITVPLTFNSPMKLFSGPFHTLFPVKFSDPDSSLQLACCILLELIQGMLNCSFRHLSLFIFIKSCCHVLQWGLTVAPN